MRLEDLVYDVREVDWERIPEDLKHGQVTILGDAEELGQYAHKTYMDFLRGMVMAVTAPVYLAVYLYERLLHHIWPDPYDNDDDSDLLED